MDIESTDRAIIAPDQTTQRRYLVNKVFQCQQKLYELTLMLTLLWMVLASSFPYNMRLPHVNQCVLRDDYLNEPFNCSTDSEHYWSGYDMKRCYIDEFGPTPCGIDQSKCGKSSWYGGGIISFVSVEAVFSTLILIGWALRFDVGAVGLWTSKLLTVVSAVSTCLFVTKYAEMDHCTSVLALTASTSATGMCAQLTAFFQFRKDFWLLHVALALIDVARRLPKGILHVMNVPSEEQTGMLTVITVSAAVAGGSELVYRLWRRWHVVVTDCATRRPSVEDAGSDKPTPAREPLLGATPKATICVTAVFVAVSAMTLISNKMLYSPPALAWNGYDLIFGPIALFIVNVVVASAISIVCAKKKGQFLRNTVCGIFTLSVFQTILVFILLLMSSKAIREQLYGTDSTVDYMHATAMYFGTTVALEVKVIATHYLWNSPLLLIGFSTPGFLDGAMLQYGADIYDGIETVSGTQRLAVALGLSVVIMMSALTSLAAMAKWTEKKAECETEREPEAHVPLNEIIPDGEDVWERREVDRDGVYI